MKKQVVRHFFELFYILSGLFSVKRFTKGKGHKRMTDKELMKKVHSGDKDALSAIIDRYYNDIYHFCLFLTGNEVDSYDITQDVFLRFIHYVDSYRHKNLKGYLLMIARNLCMDYFSKKKNTAALETAENIIQENRQMERVENEIVLWQALQKIPEKQREVVVLRIYEEMKFHEIAKMLGCSLSTVKSRFRLGVENMRKVLEVVDRYGK